MSDKKFTFSSLLTIIFMAGIAGLLIGIFKLIESRRDAAAGSPTPQVISLAALLARGAGDNRHVTITGLRIDPNFVTETKKGSIDRAYYLGALPGPPKAGLDYRLIIDLQHDVKARYLSLPKWSQVTGMYRPELPWGSLGRGIKEQLIERFPGVDPDKCAYLEVRSYLGTEVELSWQIILGCGSGVGLTGLLLFWLNRREKARQQAWAQRGTRWSND